MSMKRYINLVFLLCVFLYACQDTEVDELFEQSPEERVSAQVEQMKKELLNSSYGWTAYYQYANLKNENYFNIFFLEDGRAVIGYPLADGTVGKDTTTYTLRYTQQIDLVFDTYSILASIVGSSGGDFRFEFDRQEEGKIYFTTRNDETEGAGVLELSKTDTKDSYAELIALQSKMVDDPGKSFYRILALDNGEKYLMNILSLKLAWLEWTTPDTIYREKYQLEITEDGFKFQTPFQVGNTTVTHFITQENGVFEAWDNGTKVGTLDYGVKPFNYPASLTMLLEESAQGFYIMETYSAKMQGMIDRLKVNDPAFVHLQLYIFDGMLAYYRGSAAPRHIIYVMEYGALEDGITSVFTGAGGEGAGEYLPFARETFLQFNQKSFTVVPRDGLFYLVQDQDPAIWLIAQPQ